MATKAEEKVPADSWTKDEHIRASLSMYGQPSWLVEAVLADVPGNKYLTREDVHQRVDDFNKTPAKKG